MTGPQIIWLAGVSWDGIRGTDRHMATAMSRHTRILWVDPPVSPVTPGGRRHGAQRWPRPRISVIDDRMDRLTPVALPGLTRPGVRVTTAALVRGQVRWAMRRLGLEPFAVVASYLDDLLGHWGNGVVNVLYGTDDYVAGARLMGLSARRQEKQERRALAQADVVIAVSAALAQRWQSLGASPAFIPNGCWLADAGVTRPPAGLPTLARPVAGLIGQLSARIDLDLLEAVADSGLSLLIVGPVDPRWEQQRRFADLSSRPGVHYAGSVPAQQVPEYLAAMDVGITPYRDTPFNRASFPLKTLEYLGAGLPVVSTDLPAAQWLRDDLHRGGQAEASDRILVVARAPEFPDAIRAIAAGDGYRDESRASRCAALAAAHSWPRRAEAFASAIGLPQPSARHPGLPQPSARHPDQPQPPACHPEGIRH